MPVSTYNVSLDADSARFVESRLARGGYVSASEFVRELIRKARETAAREDEAELAGLLGDGLPGEEPMKEILAAKRAARKARPE